jgi:hypothetical protein
VAHRVLAICTFSTGNHDLPEPNEDFDAREAHFDFVGECASVVNPE